MKQGGRNYQKELDRIIRRNEEQGIRPKVVLHACCAPCSSYCMEYLSRYFDLTLLFYNPNMDTAEEYEKRRAELERLVKEAGFPVKVISRDYDPSPFYAMAEGLQELPEGGERCFRCYRLRMREAAKEAREEGADLFTTTLSISPHKNAEKINEIGEELAKESGVPFLPSDFKKKGGYLRSIELSREYGLYRQNYCGCIYSQRQAGMI